MNQSELEANTGNRAKGGKTRATKSWLDWVSIEFYSMDWDWVWIEFLLWIELVMKVARYF